MVAAFDAEVAVPFDATLQPSVVASFFRLSTPPMLLPFYCVGVDDDGPLIWREVFRPFSPQPSRFDPVPIKERLMTCPMQAIEAHICIPMNKVLRRQHTLITVLRKITIHKMKDEDNTHLYGLYNYCSAKDVPSLIQSTLCISP